jgi:sensor histidine kinase regulating citrate/malate metabolism
LSDFAAKCHSKDISFLHTVELNDIYVDEILFASILSNALDNALNAQTQVPIAERQIRLTLRSSHGKLLLSVENPTVQIPVFSDGIPVTSRPGHGYGTQSIRYMTERLGGNCQFSIQGNLFVVRVII